MTSVSYNIENITRIFHKSFDEKRMTFLIIMLFKEMFSVL